MNTEKSNLIRTIIVILLSLLMITSSGLEMLAFAADGDAAETATTGTQTQEQTQPAVQTAKRLKVSGADATFDIPVESSNFLGSGTPTGFVVTPQKTSMKLSWGGSGDIDGYIVLRAIGNSARYYQVAKVGKGTKSYTDKGASKKNTWYRYIIVAYKNSGSNIKVTKSAPWVGGVTTKSKKKNVMKPSFSAAGGQVYIGSTKTLKISFPKKKKYQSKSIRWTSSNPAVATVSSKGVVKGVSRGKATIYARSATGRVASTTVSVGTKPKLVKEGDNTYCIGFSGKKESGWQTINGKHYYFDKKSYAMVKGKTIDYVVIDKDGEATYEAWEAGKIMRKYNGNLRKAFNWCAGMKYVKLGTSYKKGTRYFARYAFKNHKGDCTCMASAFYYMAKAKGLNVSQKFGYVPSRRGGLSTHSWTVINGRVYDPYWAHAGGRGWNFSYGTRGTLRYTNITTMHM